jgi:membrane protein YdbS with pleckstrin-like domain
MRCNQCGAEVADNALFCQQCGKRLAAGAAAAPAAAAARSAAPNNIADLPETTLWEGSFSGKALIGTWIACGVLSIAIIAAGLFFSFAPPVWMLALVAIALVWLYPLVLLGYNRLSVRYRLTNQRFFHERGILKRVTDRIEVIDMDDISFEQGLVERMLGVGTIRITSSDRTHGRLTLKGIDDVAKVASLIDEARRAERSRRGIYIESV